MKFNIENWTISKLARMKSELLLSPRYQRGEAWKDDKQALLIDTILMGYDVPKIYLSKNRNNILHNYDVVDGQQRLRSVFGFIGLDSEHRKKPLLLKKRHGLEWSNADSLEFTDLSEPDRRSFLNTEITVSVVSGATSDQLRRLFLRLQMGSSLNQAELRNALASVNGDHINSIVDTHQFFQVTSIPATRYKRHDYLAQGILLALGAEGGNFENVDAESAKELYLSETLPMAFWRKVNKTLEAMFRISKHNPRAFYFKWMFVDFFCYFWTKDIEVYDDQASRIATNLLLLEEERNRIKKEPEQLLGRKDSDAKLLLGYVDAFYKDGGLAKNLEKRQNYIQSQNKFLIQQ